MSVVNVEKNLEASIKIMRDFCDQAERSLSGDWAAQTPEEKIAEVVHKFAWGMANASQGIVTALSECSRARKCSEAVEVVEGGK